jgi:hypothetical protein
MKNFIFTTILVLAGSSAVFAQNEKTIAKPVEKSPPVLMTGQDFERLEFPASLDSFGNIENDRKRARLEMYAGMISDKNETIEYVIQLKAQNKKDVGRNMKFIYQFLTGEKKIKPERISFAVDSEGKEETRLWLVPNKKIQVPLCMDCPIVKAEDEDELKAYFELKKSEN